MPDGYYEADEIIDQFKERRRPKAHNLEYEFGPRSVPTEAEYGAAMREAAVGSARVASFARQKPRRAVVPEEPVTRVPVIRRVPVRKE